MYPAGSPVQWIAPSFTDQVFEGSAPSGRYCTQPVRSLPLKSAILGEPAAGAAAAWAGEGPAPGSERPRHAIATARAARTTATKVEAERFIGSSLRRVRPRRYPPAGTSAAAAASTRLPRSSMPVTSPYRDLRAIHAD